MTIEKGKLTLSTAVIQFACGKVHTAVERVKYSKWMGTYKMKSCYEKPMLSREVDSDLYKSYWQPVMWEGAYSNWNRSIFWWIQLCELFSICLNFYSATYTTMVKLPW